MVVRYEVRGDIALITLDRPHRLNAVVPELLDGFCRALERGAAEGVRAAILTGEGRAFCAGHDLKQESTPGDYESARSSTDRTQDIMRLVRKVPYPVIAAVNGYAVGAGCEFALCSDLIVASDTASFQFPEVSVGLSITGGISHLLPLAVGLARAKELVLLGEFFSAREALAMGLINAVVPAEELMDAAFAMTEKLVAQPRQSLIFAKQVLDAGAQSSLDSALLLEAAHAVTTLQSESARVAASSFGSTHSK